MRKTICVSCFAALCAVCASSLYPRQYQFTGEPITDSRTGYTIMRDTSQDITAITNIDYKFGLLLPNSKDWTIKLESPDYLLANSDNINASLQQIVDSTVTKDTNQFLDDYSSKISTVPGLKKKEILTYDNTRILMNIIDAAEVTGSDKMNDYVQYNYFVAKNGVKSILFLHISFLINKYHTSNFDQIRTMKLLSTGFDPKWNP
jgi:hypothetical protein